MVSVGHERRAPYLPTHPDAKHSDCLVAYEADQRSRLYHPQEPHGLGAYEPLHGLVSGNHRAEEDDEDYDHPGQVLYSPVPEREAPADTQTGERERNPERYGGSRISEVVDGVGEQGDTAREQHHDELQEGRRHQPHERPLDGPYTTLGGGYGWIHSPVGMAVSPAPVVVVVPVFFAMVACHRGDFTATLLIHRSAWKVNSANFAQTEFYEVRFLGFLGSPHPESCVATIHELWAYGRQERLELATV